VRDFNRLFDLGGGIGKDAALRSSPRRACTRCEKQIGRYHKSLGTPRGPVSFCLRLRLATREALFDSLRCPSGHVAVVETIENGPDMERTRNAEWTPQ